MDERQQRMFDSLEGLSVGDAFGQNLFYTPVKGKPGLLQMRVMPSLIWRYTDDTQMALSVVAILRQHGQINQAALAQSFADRYEKGRGYGAAMPGLFEQIKKGVHWQEAVSRLFSGRGSFGNGAAMRIAPLGAYFADDVEKAAEQARLSAEVTHAHPEGIAGGIAVAVAAAVAWQTCEETLSRPEFIDRVLPHIPESEVQDRVRRARDMVEKASIGSAVRQLGNGSQISAQDTVGFCLWCAGQHLNHYEDALWLTASGGGDIDTNCAIVGGILGARLGQAVIPEIWRTSREPLPSWAYQD